VQRTEAYGCSEFVDSSWVFQCPRAYEAVTHVIDPLCSVALRTVFVHSDAIFEVGGLPGGEFSFGSVALQILQGLALEVRVSDGMLRNKPCCFGAVIAGQFFVWPSVLGDDLFETSRVLAVNRFHLRNVEAAQLSGIEQLLAYAEIVLFHLQ
jgi:hypothetical protein